MLRYEIYVDHGETANKCTIMPLCYRDDFQIHHAPFAGPLSAPILLHHEGEALWQLQEEKHGIHAVAAVDCVWRRLDPILTGLAHPLPRLVSIPRDFVTAYPRRSKMTYDPDGGLATIEALFIASAFLGHWDLSLLREYFFAEEFLNLNSAVFRNYGITPPVTPYTSLYNPKFPKNARKRRLYRGRQSES